MSKLHVDQKNILSLFSDKKSDFLIPDYQRPYAWGEAECQTLWDDIFAFAFPNNNCDDFNTSEEYFLGAIVTFENENHKKEIIDGQQRLTTLMLLLRAFHERFSNMQDKESIKTRQRISECLWRTNEFGDANSGELKINSEVATGDDKEEFLNILKNGSDALPNNKKRGRYATNYMFFRDCIDNFLNKYPSYFAYLPTRILLNCILLPIEAESQETALRIFSTLNDRGLPLSDADIFKAQLYKYYSNKNQKDSFITKWKELEEICNRVFHPIKGTPMDELFTRYMYFVRAKKGIKASTTEALRKFYERDKYAVLEDDEVLTNLTLLANFWEDVSNQRTENFSVDVLKKLFVLNYAPNGMWNYFLSVYFLHNKDQDCLLNQEELSIFLDKITAFTWAYSFTNPGVNALRTPVYAEMVNVVNDRKVSFSDFKFNSDSLTTIIRNLDFNNLRPITKSVLAWWAFYKKEQPLLILNTSFQIEHIVARKRQEIDKVLKNAKNLEAIGNKSLLEQKINIRAADYRFTDRKKYYQGYTSNKGTNIAGTLITELIELSQKNEFSEADIENRTNAIINGFIKYLAENDLLL